MSATYDPKLLIADYATSAGSPWAETSFSTDTPTMPKQTAMGFAQTGFSTDSATQARELGLAIIEDNWVV